VSSPVRFISVQLNEQRVGDLAAFFSVLSTPIFKYLHHEPLDFRISEPELGEVERPLASANIALAWLIFFPEARMAATIEQRLRCCDRFDSAT
jgi:hypothetical protein